MPPLKERKIYRSKYQCELVAAVTGRSEMAIKKFIQRRRLTFDTSGYSVYLNEWMKENGRERKKVNELG
jgi:hypothetical protein